MTVGAYMWAESGDLWTKITKRGGAVRFFALFRKKTASKSEAVFAIPFVFA